MKRHGNSKYKTPYEVTINSILNRYKQKAKIRGLEWSLTHQQARALILSNCYYCDTHPKNQHNVYVAKNGNYKVNRPEWAELAWVSFNGIDRYYNELGYTTQNTVTCCTFCNYAKHDKDPREFMRWIEQLANFRKREV